MIKRISFHRFKRFKDETIELHRQPITLLAGGNNAGKSSILHGLAVWEFCRTVIAAERGDEAFFGDTPQNKKTGVGLGDDEFSPVNVPSLNHLWTNLRTQKADEPDGYTLKIGCYWDTDEGREVCLEFGLSLANDRLFVKTTRSTLQRGDTVPRVAYLPPFAGITDREMRMPGAIRRRRIGEGLAGAVLRNLLLDMYEANKRRRSELRGDRNKIANRDLAQLRGTDPWELLMTAVRDTFQIDLRIQEFSEEYHSYIRVDVVKGGYEGKIFKAHKNYNKRDLMVEGSGFLQWLSVYTLATNPLVDVLLLDEPDAHLHASLQQQMLDKLDELATQTGKQVLIATHSTEILRNAEPSQVLEIRTSERNNTRYLSEQSQKVGLLAGLGSDYAPRIDQARRFKRILFLEGRSDVAILREIARVAGYSWPGGWVLWVTTSSHQERLHVTRALRDEIPGLIAISLRDRDDASVNTVAGDLTDKGLNACEFFQPLRWRRRNIESYLLWPPAIARASGLPEEEIRASLQERHAVAIPDSFAESDPPRVLLDLDGKQVLKTGNEALFRQMDVHAVDVATSLQPEEVCADFRLFFEHLAKAASLATGVLPTV